MYIGETVRLLEVEPIVDPVPDGDRPGRPADAVPAPPTPTPAPRAGTPAGERDEREPVPARP